MINIRNKVFETNSSSTHSVSIASSKGLLETIVPTEGVITLTGGEFGWEFEKFNDALTKANYAAVFADGTPELESMLNEVLLTHTGAKEIKKLFSCDFHDENFSYIDHQSAIYEDGKAKKAFANHKTLKNFLFNPNSWLYLGNDNDNVPGFYNGTD